jgi:uncharacterized protein YndB with AHSA1/START domain
MHPLPSGPSELVLQGDFEAFSPQELFDYWVTPSLLTQWWPEEAQVNACPGGEYCFSWPSMNWTLQGTFKEIAPGERLSFTWKWNHDPQDEEHLVVTVDFAGADTAGTLLTIHHGPYGDSEEDQEARQGHLEGWIHFCMKLAGLRDGIQDSTIMDAGEAPS